MAKVLLAHEQVLDGKHCADTAQDIANLLIVVDSSPVAPVRS